MKEEIARILKLVQEGKLSADDAAELIDAFSGDENAGSPTGTESPQAESPEASTAPPPTGGAAATEGSEATADAGAKKDPFKHFTDFMSNLEREVRESVDWKEVASQVRQGAQKGVEAAKKAVEDIRAGNLNVGFFGSTENREVTLPLTVPEGKLLRIENPCGNVRISGGFTDGTVNAKARVRGSSVDEARTRAEEYTLVVEESDHTVVIRQPRIAALSVDMVVQLASQSPVDVKTESGDVQVLDTGAAVKVNSASGNVSVRGANGPIDVNAHSGDLSVEDSTSPMISIESKSGDISLKKVDGNINMRVASGEISLTECKGKTISIESVSGNVVADFSEPITGSVNIRTVNGDAAVSVPDGCDCRVSLSTLRGDVNCEVDLNDEAKGDQRITGRLGDGTGSIDISGINGDISVRMHDSAAQ